MKAKLHRITPLQNLFLVLACMGLLAMPAPAQTFTTLYSFANGIDGANPYAGLILSSNTLYGTASAGGSVNAGTVFSLNLEDMSFTTLHSFTNGNDGATPYAGGGATFFL